MYNTKELFQYIRAYYPWFTDEEVRSYLILETPWPIMKNFESVKAYIRTKVVNNWDQYLEDLKKHGYEGAEKPEAKIMHPATMILCDMMAVPNGWSNLTKETEQ